MMNEENSDDGFVSIDLDDDFEECDICHQCTTERIVHVILSDEFTRFEGSHEKYGGSLTRAHEICLEKWSEIIERNIKLRKENEKSKFKDIELFKPVEDNVFDNDVKDIINERFLDRKTENELQMMENVDIEIFLRKLEDAFSATSNELVGLLQVRDKLKNEISGQKSHIEQLVKMETKPNTINNNKGGGGIEKNTHSPKLNKLIHLEKLHISV